MLAQATMLQQYVAYHRLGGEEFRKRWVPKKDGNRKAKSMGNVVHVAGPLSLSLSLSTLRNQRIACSWQPVPAQFGMRDT